MSYPPQWTTPAALQQQHTPDLFADLRWLTPFQLMSTVHVQGRTIEQLHTVVRDLCHMRDLHQTSLNEFRNYGARLEAQLANAKAAEMRTRNDLIGHIRSLVTQVHNAEAAEKRSQNDLRRANDQVEMQQSEIDYLYAAIDSLGDDVNTLKLLANEDRAELERMSVRQLLPPPYSMANTRPAGHMYEDAGPATPEASVRTLRKHFRNHAAQCLQNVASSAAEHNDQWGSPNVAAELFHQLTYAVGDQLGKVKEQLRAFTAEPEDVEAVLNLLYDMCQRVVNALSNMELPSFHGIRYEGSAFDLIWFQVDSIMRNGLRLMFAKGWSVLLEDERAHLNSKFANSMRAKTELLEFQSWSQRLGLLADEFEHIGIPDAFVESYTWVEKLRQFATDIVASTIQGIGSEEEADVVPEAIAGAPVSEAQSPMMDNEQQAATPRPRLRGGIQETGEQE
ncbi:hypothetical protein M8818_003498 [Zalaria obscura]|uniref:Uncharacterized protein n=1 Tax=Zalaria obscura TaxID=2024903 RepID=A0ACC3SIT1_9PEZI